MSGQFLKDEYRYLRQREYLHFLLQKESVTWRLLRMRIWRPRTGQTMIPRGHMMGAFYAQGWLAAGFTIDQLVADYRGVRSRSAIARDIASMQEMGILEYYPAPKSNDRPSVVRLGEWQWIQDKDRRREYVEILYVQRLWDISRDPEPWAEDHDTAAVTSDDPLSQIWDGDNF